jgi:uncharacterized protein (DUF927 family)
MPVLVAEGEKAADAAAAMLPGFVAVSPMNGAKSPHKADWSHVKGRDVLIWPDNDEPGAKFAQAVARLCLAAGAKSVRIVTVPPGAPEGWDLADPLPAGWTHETITAALATAASVVAPANDNPAGAAPYERQGDFLVALDWFTWSDGERHRPGVYTVAKQQNGLEKLMAEVDGATSLEVEVLSWLCSLLEIVAETRSAAGDQWGLLLRVTDGDGTAHEWAMPMEELAGDGTSYRERLLSLGLRLAPGKKARETLARYLTVWRTPQRARCVDRVGWHGDLFVMPDAVYGDAKGERVALQAPGATPEFRTAGTLEGWRQEIAALAVGNSRLVMAICAGLAAPLARLAGEENGGFHLHGGSSIGKTTTLHVGRSVWGTPLGSWRTTDNGAEGLARASCDTLLPLDEIGQGDPKAVEAMAYLLGNGQGKQRAHRDGTARAAATWRILFLSTGELSLEGKLAEGGRRAMAGQAVRCLEIPADAGRGYGLFDTLHGFPDGDALARHLKAAADRNCGHAGRAFVAKLSENPEAAHTLVQRARADYAAAWAPAGADGQVRRGAGRFALLAAAGELAAHWGIVPWPPGEAERGIKRCFDDWLAARGGSGSAEETAALRQVRLFLEQHGSSRFETPWREGVVIGAAAERTVNRAGFRKPGERDGWTYYVLPGVWSAEVCKGYDPKMVAKAMAERGFLKPEGTKLAASARVPGHGKQRFYTILPSFLTEREEG